MISKIFQGSPNIRNYISLQSFWKHCVRTYVSRVSLKIKKDIDIKRSSNQNFHVIWNFVYYRARLFYRARLLLEKSILLICCKWSSRQFSNACGCISTKVAYSSNRKEVYQNLFLHQFGIGQGSRTTMNDMEYRYVLKGVEFEGD